MRLLNVHRLEFEDFHKDPPKYIATSHRWSAGNEAMIEDVINRRNTHKSGYKKVEGFAKYVREHVGYVDWIWIDTCCVKQDSSQEVSEAVNSMFAWYSQAEMCLAYLADVDDATDDGQFKRSEWFMRGWTLQELLAPPWVVFLSKQWKIIGRKSNNGYTTSSIDSSGNRSLEPIIATVTGIPERVLHDYAQSKDFDVDEKWKWMAGRETTRPEDVVYGLLGIFSLTMTIRYGEGVDAARQRLLRKISKHNQDTDSFQKIVTWLSPPDPWVNHHSARQRHERHTGTWLLQSDQYRRWKDGKVTSHLWLYGKAGCGKTVLCSTLIDDIQTHCGASQTRGYAVFYFSFSDNQKQSYDSLLLSLITQIGWKDSSLSMLQGAYEKRNRGLPGAYELEGILYTAIASYDEVFLLVDALDECPEPNDARRNVLDLLNRLAKKSRGLRILVTSRELHDIRESLESLDAVPVFASVHHVDADISKYLSTEISRDRMLSRLVPSTKAHIEETLAGKANGMFRWAYCQLQELKKLKSTKPKYVKAALHSLPPTLDETYERMLIGIGDVYYKEALTLLQWIAFAERPLTLRQLSEAAIIDPADKGLVDVENRGSLEDTLRILSGLVNVDNNIDNENDDDSDAEPMDEFGGKRVRFAHFSVQEYLQSARILECRARAYHLDRGKGHQVLAESCLTYLTFYTNEKGKALAKGDLDSFPLLLYAAQSWPHHSRLQNPGGVERQIAFLNSEDKKHNWLCLHPYHRRWDLLWKGSQNELASGFFYASLEGLEAVVYTLIQAGADVNAHEDPFHTALTAASTGGYDKVVQMLIDARANVDARGGRHAGTALIAASEYGHEKVVHMLIDAGADVNARGGRHKTALIAASKYGYEKVVQTLIDAGADVNARGGGYGSTALIAASEYGHKKVVHTLINAGADVNARGHYDSTALIAASKCGNENAVQMLIDAGADVNARGRYYDSTALIVASENGYEKVVQLLINAGADVNARGGYYHDFGTALTAASKGGHDEVMQMLIDAGAEVNTEVDISAFPEFGSEVT